MWAHDMYLMDMGVCRALGDPHLDLGSVAATGVPLHCASQLVPVCAYMLLVTGLLHTCFVQVRC